MASTLDHSVIGHETERKKEKGKAVPGHKLLMSQLGVNRDGRGNDKRHHGHRRNYVLVEGFHVRQNRVVLHSSLC